MDPRLLELLAPLRTRGSSLLNFPGFFISLFFIAHNIDLLLKKKLHRHDLYLEKKVIKIFFMLSVNQAIAMECSCELNANRPSVSFTSALLRTYSSDVVDEERMLEISSCCSEKWIRKLHRTSNFFRYANRFWIAQVGGHDGLCSMKPCLLSRLHLIITFIVNNKRHCSQLYMKYVIHHICLF